VPGGGKTTFFEAFYKFAKKKGVKVLFIKLKDCVDETEEVEVPNLEEKVVKRISSILHFTAPEGVRPSFDLLVTSDCSDIDCLIDFAEKKYKSDVSIWVVARLIVLKKKFIRGNKLVIYKCLEEYDELIRRLNIGLTYSFRSYLRHLLLMDDALAIILNSLYGNIWPLMMRPYWASFNYCPQPHDFLRFDPVILAPCSDYGGLYKLASDKYIVMYRRQKWELSPDEVYALARS
jgi:hypothetical protein